jgi:GLPGLI family protein
MKNSILFFIFLTHLFCGSLNAQELKGVAYYTSIIKNEMKLDSSKMKDPQYVQMTEMLSKPFYDNFELKFTKTESAFNVLPKLEKPDPTKEKGMNISITMMPSGEILYKNLLEGIFVNNKEVYGKKFLISDTLKKQDWKLENESKMIGDYTCFKATFIKEVEKYRDDEDDFINTKKEKQLVTAWYTPQIPTKNGPSSYDGLPGLILEIKDGELKYLCTKIVLNPAEPIEIKKPSKGKKVGKDEYKAIMKKKMAEMMESFKNKKESRN